MLPTLAVDRRSWSSFVLDLYSQAPPSIGVATGFLVAVDDAVALVTNYHVLSGRDADTDRPLDGQARLPDRVMLVLPVDGQVSFAGWRGAVWRLEDDAGERLWFTHPSHGRRVDVAVLPLGLRAELGLSEHLTYGLDPGAAFRVPVSANVSIIGFPEGLPTAGLTAIWKSGHVASEADLDVDGRPYFWIDAAGAPGMSGSPVLARVQPGIWASDRTGGQSKSSAVRDQVLGIYSGRARADTSLGRCWRWTNVVATVQHALADLRSGRMSPLRAELGVYRNPDDVRVPRVDADGRWLTLLAEEVATAGFFSLQDVRTAAVLRAALADTSEPNHMVLPRRDGANLQRVLARLQRAARVDVFTDALRASLDGESGSTSASSMNSRF